MRVERSKKEALMEQQQAPFHESSSYDARHEEAPQYSGYFPNSRQQKLSPKQQLMAPTAGQRLILAITSLSLLFVMFLIIITLIAAKLLTPDMATSVIPVIVMASLGLIAAVIVVNVVFNRKQ